MAVAKKNKDSFDQIMGLTLTMSASNTLSFSEVAIGMSIFDYAALIISRIEYFFDSTTVIANLVASADVLYCAITGSDGIADLEIQRPEVYDLVQLSVMASGTPASAGVIQMPFVHDFSQMEGGGLLVPAQNLFLAGLTSGFTVAGIMKARIYYRVKALDASDFIELAQRLRVLTT